MKKRPRTESSTAGVHVAKANASVSTRDYVGTHPGRQGIPNAQMAGGQTLFLQVSTYMNASNPGENSALEKQTVVLRVRYAPVKAPYVDPHANVSMTLAEVKVAALNHFHLTEGAVDGGTKTYQLSFDDIIQSNMSVTLSSLVTHGKELELLLIEQFVQG